MRRVDSDDLGNERTEDGFMIVLRHSILKKRPRFRIIPSCASRQNRLERIFHPHLVFMALLLLPIIAMDTVRAGESVVRDPSDPVTAAFSAYDASATTHLDYSLWSRFLSKTVVYAGHSKKRLPKGRKRVWIGSQMRFGNDLPSRYENNRIVLGRFNDAHMAFMRRYRRALEALPERVPLAGLDRAEQLAYWLNLYNVRALELVATHYPAETTRTLRNAPGTPEKGTWYEPTLKVAGVALSLRDIETRILFPIWHDPLVLYGLWQGAIGGPRLPLHAYQADSVWDMLEGNAREFINSNRGMKPNGRVLEVSLLYGWGAPLFADDASLRHHIEAYAVTPFSLGLEKTETIRITLYDWHLADLSGGTHHRGQWNNMAPLLWAMGSEPRSQALADFALSADTTHRAMPPQTIELLRKMERFNDRDRKTIVTVEECPPGESCIPLDEDEAPPRR